MARKSRNRNSGLSGSSTRTAGWKETTPAILLVSAVFGILIISAVLQTDSDVRPPEPMVSEVRTVPEQSPETRQDGSRDGTSTPGEIADDRRLADRPDPTSLERRSRDDYRRLSKNRSGWTLQIMIACDPANAEKMLERTGNSEKLYILPFDHRGQRCFRICWGSYPSPDSARAAGDLSPGIDRDLDRYTPKSIAEVAP